MKRQIAMRAMDDAYRTATPPRTKAAFAERVTEGRIAFPEVLGQLVRVAVDLVGELEKVRAQVKVLANRPGATRTALDDINAQLKRLAPADLMRATSLERLVHITRYLKAVTMRLQRLSHDPQKDQQKAAQVAPFQKQVDDLAAKQRDVEDLAWLLEEFRVQTFAPELKTAVPVSAQRLAAAISAA
jgi:ATP-dependent helicase HrpA